MRVFRQGDVLIREVPKDHIPMMLSGTQTVKRDQRTGKVTLAYGEVTGHHHTFSDKSKVNMFAKAGEAEMFEGPSGGNSGARELAKLRHGVESDPLMDPTLRRFIDVQSEVALLEHQEHTTIEVPRGFYEVVIQREYAGRQEIRRVAD
jgi:hypothetical protein